MKKSAYLTREGNVDLRRLEFHAVVALHHLNPCFAYGACGKGKSDDVNPKFRAVGFNRDQLPTIVKHFLSGELGQAYQANPVIDVEYETLDKKGNIGALENIETCIMGIEISIKDPEKANNYFQRHF